MATVHPRTRRSIQAEKDPDGVTWFRVEDAKGKLLLLTMDREQAIAKLYE